MMHHAALDQAFAKSAKHFAREHDLWTLERDQQRRGRWVVVEPGIGRLLKDLPRAEQLSVDLLSGLRARRFTSLSHARKFAKIVGGVIRRWRRKPPGAPSGTRWDWAPTPSYWESATRLTGLYLHLAKAGL